MSLPRALFPQETGPKSRFWMLLLVAGILFLAHSSPWPFYAAGWWGYWDTQRWCVWLWQYPGGLSRFVTANCLFSGIFLLCQHHLGEDQMLLVSIFCSLRGSKNLLLFRESNAQAWTNRFPLFTWKAVCDFQRSKWTYGCFSFQHRMEHCFGDSGGADMSMYFKDCKLVHSFLEAIWFYLPRFKMQILLTEEFCLLPCIPKV